MWSRASDTARVGLPVLRRLLAVLRLLLLPVAADPSDQRANSSSAQRGEIGVDRQHDCFDVDGFIGWRCAFGSPIGVDSLSVLACRVWS